MFFLRGAAVFIALCLACSTRADDRVPPVNALQAVHLRFQIVELSPAAAAEFFAAAKPTSDARGTANIPATAVYTNAQEVFGRLREAKKLKTLGTSDVVAVFDETATILSGGEFPLLIPVETEKVAVAWHPVGMRCTVVPELYDSGDVLLEFEGELATRDFANGVEDKGMVIPALITRKAKAKARVARGETLVVAGENWETNPVSGMATPLDGAVTLFLVTPGRAAE